MQTKHLGILFIIPAILAKVDINIVASDNEAERAAEVAGNIVDIISDEERSSFGISDNSLKNAVGTYFGKRPDDAFVRSPTPWGDLYKSYNWDQVTRILTPVRATILNVTSQPTIVMNQVFHNNSTRTATFKAQIQQKVQNTITSKWEKGGDLTVGQSIEYGIKVEAVSVSGKTSMSYSSQWGKSVSKAEAVSVGSESGVQITLEPNQEVIAELYATRGTMQIKVDYEATLSGDTAINYGRTYKGHHFWALGINDVMRAADISTSISSSEIISVGYYTRSNVVIRDGGVILKSIDV
ncbi:spherulin-2A-like [Achroia grisella]|uniref:spherulin-2A-like n=1 Tax=Achroia grisella TaxID=688607 RepID=UPI0027D34660|nr:spherulin-2A-like [Achroia grisella]